MKEYGFGADVGGTTIKMGLFRTDGTLLDKWEIPTDTSNCGEGILQDIADSVHDKMVGKDLTKDMVEGIGIGIPGAVDHNGVVNKAVNLGWDVVPVKEELENLSGMRVRVGNDANVAALGENWMGSGKGYKSIVMVTLGTGIGGGIIIDGKILIGANGAAGEIGHIVVDDQEQESCNCGHHGCIEQYASATGIARMARRTMASTDAESSMRAFGEEISAKNVFDCAKAGDELACQVVTKVCDMLGATMASIGCVVNPDAFVIGGGVSKAGEILLDYLKKPFQKNIFHASKDTRIVLATLGNDAGIYGAMRMLLD
ncbi:MAG: ROK family glucokinase [Lachnospiraceae bacterium]|nr:ROK family glucokinase [Lachnospiraceae bacterium]MDD6192097.1 ROK family glucokinase [Lachnospiraceae bacterium]MDY4793435.1 ROK family glucokinase [Pararoseburia sp.]